MKKQPKMGTKVRIKRDGLFPGLRGRTAFVAGYGKSHSTIFLRIPGWDVGHRGFDILPAESREGWYVERDDIEVIRKRRKK